MDLSIKKLRDPFLLENNGTYYAYGTYVTTDWENTRYGCYKNTDGNLNGEWKLAPDGLYERPTDGVGQFWAPEVHKYKDKFYMLATYRAKSTGHRGVTVMRADSPEGTFKEISNGHITPHGWDCIDGTLYVDEDGCPWLIFVHEWTCTDDGIGRMDAMKLSDDLTCAVSEPKELFRADEPEWALKNRVTDGPFMHKTDDDTLLMIWSNFCADGYCVGVAKSDNGKVDGNWIQYETLLYKRKMKSEYDGGHGMIFRDVDGKLYLCIHSPNEAIERREEVPTLYRVEEKNGTLVLHDDI